MNTFRIKEMFTVTSLHVVDSWLTFPWKGIALFPTIHSDFQLMQNSKRISRCTNLQSEHDWAWVGVAQLYIYDLPCNVIKNHI